jgi:nitrous oxidase accessory protein NosD
MRSPLFSLLVPAALVLAIAACSDDSSNPAGPPKPSTDRYVNQTTGDDSNNGSQASPWATISYAVATADSEITIHVAAGTYNAASGETFPITLKYGQKLIGNVSNKGAGANPTLISGQGAYALGFLVGTTVVGAQGARVAGFSIANETNQVSYAALSVDGVTMEVDHNTFPDLTYTGIAASNLANVEVHDNLFQNSSYGLVLDGSGFVSVHDNTMEGGSYGVRVFGIDSLDVADNTISVGSGGIQGGFGASTTIRNNTINKTPGNYGGIICSSGTPVIRGNTFTGASALYVQDDGAPDAGTLADLGHNNFYAITAVTIQHTGTGTVMAVGNTWPHNPPTLGVDYTITGGGTVVTQ